MDTLFEQRVSHNAALGAFAISEAASRFLQATTIADGGMPLLSTLLVLPLAYHRRTAAHIGSRQMTEGSFFRAIAEDHTISLGLQHRLMSMAGDTFKAIHLAAAGDLIKLSTTSPPSIVAVSKSRPQTTADVTVHERVSHVLAAARRVGYWLATNDLSVVCALLRVRF